ncbi:MAG: hypothetical protein JJE49_06740 [Peptostreptococcaceae bacterium]|nr:hypothetical protein [Peptostreptococcaceae bacterium]
MGYARWENFEEAIGRAFDSCQNIGIKTSDHFREVTKMVELGSGANRNEIKTDSQSSEENNRIISNSPEFEGIRN